MNAIKNFLREKKVYGSRKKHSVHNVKNFLREKKIKMPKTMFVVSPYKGRFRVSRPCNECIKVMRLYGIKKVVYSTGNPESPFCKEDVATMPLNGSSRGNL